LQLQAEEIRIVGIQGRIQIGFDRGQIDSVIFQTRVITHHQKAECGKHQNQNSVHHYAGNADRGEFQKPELHPSTLRTKHVIGNDDIILQFV
jgi:hypothetical protein